MEKQENYLVQLLKGNVRQYGMFIALIVIMGVFQFLTDGIFLTPRNITNLFLQTSYISVLAIGMVLVIVAGHIDLSVGSIAAFTGAISAILQVNNNFGTIPTIIITLICGAAIGFWQGFWIAYKKIPAFIVTLAGMLVFRGAVIWITQGATIAPYQDSFKAIGQGFIPAVFTFEKFDGTAFILFIISMVAFIFTEIKKRIERIKYDFAVLPMPYFIGKIIAISILIAFFFRSMVAYRGVPYSALIVVVLVLVFTFISNKTITGRHIYAIGGNLEAAKLSGINVKKTLLKVFVAMGLLASLSGLIFSARLDSAAPSAGNLFELDAIAAAFIGGASATGGVGTVIGAIVGGLVMASINNGMSLMNVDSSYQYVIKGLVLLMAVWFDISTRNKK
ncbi:MAG: multiple monosaccharide ABC transporter permease [Fusobacteriaceae bacterium]